MSKRPFGVCWGGMAMINHFHGDRRSTCWMHKAFGCFRHLNLVADLALSCAGSRTTASFPVSRWTEMRQSEIDWRRPGLKTLAWFSNEVGPCLVEDPDHRALYIFNHFEYDSDTLKQEYDRDIVEATGRRSMCP